MSTATSPDALPTARPGQSAPLAIITPTDQSGVILIATALCLIFALFALLIRLFIRFGFRSEFAKDDIAAFGSMVSSGCL